MNMPVALRRLWIQMTADRRRFGLFCAMLGVGLLLWARLIIITNTPRTVVADDKAQQSSQSAKSSKASTPAASPSTTAVERPKTPLRVVLATSPQRDPFVISNEHFPRPVVGVGMEEERGKSAPKQTEDSLQARYARLAERLKLEAILSPGGGQPLVVINGKTYRINDDIPVPRLSPGEAPVHFRLVHVGERAATLEFEGQRFERTLRQVTNEK